MGIVINAGHALVVLAIIAIVSLLIASIVSDQDYNILRWILSIIGVVVLYWSVLLGFYAFFIF